MVVQESPLKKKLYVDIIQCEYRYGFSLRYPIAVTILLISFTYEHAYIPSAIFYHPISFLLHHSIRLE